MPKKISNEDLINYLTNECDLELSKSIEDAIKHDETLAKELDQLKELRMLQAETMVPLLNKEMPKQTENLIDSIKEKKTTSILWVPLGLSIYTQSYNFVFILLFTICQIYILFVLKKPIPKKKLRNAGLHL